MMNNVYPVASFAKYLPTESNHFSQVCFSFLIFLLPLSNLHIIDAH